MFEPTYYRRCTCREPVLDDEGRPVLTDKGNPKMRWLETKCPRLKQKDHGSWYFYLELEAGPEGKRQRVRRGGFKTRNDAKKKAKELYDDATGGTDVLSDETCGAYFRRWIAAKKTLARTTRQGYQEHIDLYLEPHLGHVKRRDLRVIHLDRMYDAIERDNHERVLHHLRVAELAEARDAAKRDWVRASGNTEERRRTRRIYLEANAALREGRKGLRKITSPATLHRINDTLSSALTWGIKREGAFAKNWARLVELPPVTRPKPLVWTPERVEHWKRTGEKPGPVMVWTAAQTGQFLDLIKDDRLFPLWHTFIARGPRRGEMCALPWSEVSLTDAWLRVSAQTVEVAYRTYGEAPKADSVRTMRLGAESVTVLGDWKAVQQREKGEWSGVGAYVETNLVFTHENGEPLHPDWVSRRFKRLVELSGLPPVRLHDARHISASLSLLAGVDIKVVQERLGHSSRQITSDTYTSVLPELEAAEADATLSVIPREATYSVRKRLTIPESAFQDGLLVLYAHAHPDGDAWTIAARLRPDSELLGQARTAARDTTQAAAAAQKWLADHAAKNGLVVLRAEHLHEQLPQKVWGSLSLTRFTLSHDGTASLGEWLSHGPNEGQPAASD